LPARSIAIPFGSPIVRGRFFCSYDAEKGAGGREFFDAPVIRVGDQNISLASTQSSWESNFPIFGSLAAFKHGSAALLGQGAELGCGPSA